MSFQDYNSLSEMLNKYVSYNTDSSQADLYNKIKGIYDKNSYYAWGDKYNTNSHMDFCDKCDKEVFISHKGMSLCKEHAKEVIFECSICNKPHSILDFYHIDNKICNDCADKVSECLYCHKTKMKSAFEKYKKFEECCDDCFPHVYKKCSCCNGYFGKEFVTSGVIDNNSGKKIDICNTCFKIHDGSFCHICSGTYININRVIINHTQKRICNECLKNRIKCFECESCNELYSKDNESKVKKGNCIHCCPDSVILNYRFKPYKLKFIVDDQDKYAMGVEFEIGGGTIDSCKKVVNKITNCGLVYFKRDGSIPDCGFEIVSHPVNMIGHKKAIPWEDIFGLLKKNGIQSYRNCGIHAHFSRNNFSEEKIALIDCFVNRNYEFFEKLGGREMNSFCQPVQKRTSEWGKYNDNRYLAVNLSNTDTIELRFCNSTNLYKVFMERLEVMNSIVKFCNEGNFSLKDVFYNCGKVINNYISFAKDNFSFADKIKIDEFI